MDSDSGHRSRNENGKVDRDRSVRNIGSSRLDDNYSSRHHKNSPWKKRSYDMPNHSDFTSKRDRREFDSHERESKNHYSDKSHRRTSLENRIAPREGKQTQTDSRHCEEEEQEEDEEARQRRIQRLKRRRRSAGFDSDDESITLQDIISAKGRGRDDSRRNGRGHDRKDDEDTTKRQRGSKYDYDANKDSRAYRQPERKIDRYDGRRDGRRDRDRSPRRGGRNDEEKYARDDKKYAERDRREQDNHYGRYKDRSSGRTVKSSDGFSDQDSRFNGRSRSAREVEGSNDRHSNRRHSPDARILRRRRTSSSSHGREGDSYDQEIDRDIKSSASQNADGDEIKDRNSSWEHDEVFTRAGPDEVYERVAQVGEGTYGQVFKAKSDKTGIIVALKKIRMENERDGFPITALREVKLLQGLRHENVVQLYEMMLSKHSVYMVFEYLQHDLNGVLAQPSIIFSPAHIKSLAAQLLAGLAYLHKHRILHRDLKCSNLLLDNRGTLKLADFGLARTYTKQTHNSSRKRALDYTNRVVTLWYRAPELLFGETSYDDAIDVWGAGCIFLELFLRKPVFQGNDEIHQVQLLYEILGPIGSEEWPEAERLPWFDLVRPTSETTIGSAHYDVHKDFLRRILGPEEKVPADALEVAYNLLTYNPHRRISASKALTLPYFSQNEPIAEKPARLLQNVEGEWHEFESRKARREAASQALQAHVRQGKALQEQPPPPTEISQLLSDKVISSTSTQEPVLDTTNSTIPTPIVPMEDILQDTNEKEASA